jgi:DKNYY family
MTQRRSPAMAILMLACITHLPGCDFAPPYHKKNGQWFYESQSLHVPSRVALTQLGPRFARIGDQVFYRDATIAGADPVSFVALDDEYGKDKSAAFFCDTYRDSKDLFLLRRVLIVPIPGVDASSFRVLREGYAVDTARPYFEGKPFAVRDVASFEVIDRTFSRDRVRGYYLRREIADSDGATFVPLDSYYARDQAHVYHVFLDNPPGPTPMKPAAITVANADANTFTSKSEGYAVDAKNVYYKGRAISSMPASFELLTRSYAKTAQEVFYLGTRIKGAQAASFNVLQPAVTDADAEDSGGRYLQGKRI